MGIFIKFSVIQLSNRSLFNYKFFRLIDVQVVRIQNLIDILMKLFADLVPFFFFGLNNRLNLFTIMCITFFYKSVFHGN